MELSHKLNGNVVSQPVISVIIRNYNNGTTLLRAVTSAMCQRFPANQTEIIIIDDGSDDGSVSSIEHLSRHHSLIKLNHVGLVAALNVGVRRAAGTYFTILDADDALFPHSLDVMHRRAVCPDQPVGVFGNYWEAHLHSPFYCRVNTGDNVYSTLAGGWLFDRQVVHKLGGYDEQLVFPEYDLLYQLMRHHRIAHIDQPVYYYFRHPDSYTADTKRVKHGIDQLRKKYQRDFPIRRY